jgi:hypothetical protein
VSALTRETWWRREVVPPALVWLGDELCRRFNRPRTAAGTKGDENHLNGSHRSQEWLLRSAHSTNQSYTIEPGLTDEQASWVAGFDFTPGSAAEMVSICKRLDRAVRAGEIEEIAEWYGNLGGDNRVDGYDNIRDRVVSSDPSHLWHLHISFRRRHANSLPVMRKVVSILTGEADDVALDAADKKWLTDLMYGQLPQRKDLGMKGETGLGVLWHVYQRTGRIEQAVSLVRADLIKALGRDPISEQEIVDGVLSGLGEADVQDVATILRAVFEPAKLSALVAELSSAA